MVTEDVFEVMESEDLRKEKPYLKATAPTPTQMQGVHTRKFQ
jgi:hypothetical protein